MIYGDGGDGGGAHFGDETTVEDGEWLTGIGAEELDGCEVGMFFQVDVFRIEGDRFCAHDGAEDGGHDGKPAGEFVHREHGSDGLDDTAGGEVDQGLTDGGDQVLVGEDFADLGFGQEEHGWVKRATGLRRVFLVGLAP